MKTTSILAARALALALASGVQAQQPPDSLLLKLTGGPPAIVPSASGFGVSVHEQQVPPNQGHSTLPETGQPDMSMRTLDVLLPYEADPSTLSLEVHFGPQAGPLAPVVVPLGVFYVKPVRPAATVDLETQQVEEIVPAGVTLDSHGHDLAVYGQPQFWPLPPVEIVDTSQLRKFRLVRLRFSPFLWNTGNGLLLEIAKLNVTLHWQNLPIDPQQKAAAMLDTVMSDDVASKAVNWLDFAHFYDSPYGPIVSSVDYLVITTQAFVDASSQLTAFVDLKEAQGFKTKVTTVETIAALYSETDPADRIRHYLRDRYADWGLEYLLLIGDPDPYDPTDPTDPGVGEVPMKMAWPTGDDPAVSGSDDGCPTDNYFAELSRNWDVDGDGLVGEWEDDARIVHYTFKVAALSFPVHFISHAFDFHGEIHVGRIPFSDASDADQVLEATIDYQTATLTTAQVEARQRAYLAISKASDTEDFSALGEWILSQSTDPAGLETTTLYDPDADNSPSIALEDEALIELWRDDAAGLVAWEGHGNATVAKIFYDMSDLMSDDAAHLLDDDTRAWVVHSSCHNAEPETEYNLSAKLLLEVAVGTCAATRNTFFRPGRTTFGEECFAEDVVYLMTAGLVDELPAGEALADVRSECSAEEGTESQNLLTMNLYGDPAGVYTHD